MCWCVAYVYVVVCSYICAHGMLLFTGTGACCSVDDFKTARSGSREKKAEVLMKEKWR